MKNTFAMLGLAVVFIVGAGVLWQYRAPIRSAYNAFTGSSTEMAAQTLGPGRPSNEGLQSARSKQAAMARSNGPATMYLTPSEMASLIQAELDPVAVRALDSLSVTFQPDRFVLEGVLVTDVWGRSVLGPFASFLQAREPLRVAGPAHMDRPGVIAWVPDEFSLRSIPFPQSVVTALVNSMTGGSDGVIWLAAPNTVNQLEIKPGRVTFYRQVR